MDRTVTFRVCKVFSKFREMQRILNRNRATNIKIFMEGNVTFKHIFENQVSEALPNFRIFSEFSRF